MKKLVMLLAAVGLLVGLVSMPLIAQEEAPQTGADKVDLGVGLKLSGLNYLVGTAELPLAKEIVLYASFGIAGYPQGEYPRIGMTWAAPFDVIWFWDEIEFLGRTFLWGPGVGLTLFWLTSPELPPGVTVSFANFSLLPVQIKWEGKVDDYSIFLRGGPFVTLGQGAFGLTIEGGIWLF